MATSVAVYNVIMDCSVMTSESKVDGEKVQKYLEPTINALVECFPELDKGTLYQYATEKPNSKYIILLKKLPYDQIQSFVQLQEAVDEKGKKVNPNIKGVWFEKEYQRRRHVARIWNNSSKYNDSFEDDYFSDYDDDEYCDDYEL